MGWLDGDIRTLFATAFGGMYLAGTLKSGTDKPIYDDDGDITGYSDPGDTDIKVQIDRATYAMRRAEGYIEGDVRLIILADDVPTLTTDMRVETNRGVGTAEVETFTLQSVELDPAASHWICRGRPV